MKKLFYHFTADTLRDGQQIPPVGKWLEHTGPVIPCERGLHASEHPFDALGYAPGSRLHLVELAGKIQTHGEPVDKVCASRRKIVKSIDATELLRKFARRVASDVLPLWNAPKVVKDYLETGDENLRASASASAASGVWSAARAASASAESASASASAVRSASASASAAWSAESAAESAASAESAAWSGVLSAARATSAAAAESAAESAATEKYRGWLLEMVEEALSQS